MIRRDRPPPPTWFSTEAGEALQALEEYDRRAAMSKSQRRWPFHYQLVERPDVLAVLTVSDGALCWYCESASDALRVDRFRPVEEATGLDGRVVARDHYWWLAYEWENLLPACPTCLSYKSRRFPVDGPRAAPAAGAGIPASERALFVDPSRDDPSASLRFEGTGRVTALDDRGAATIEGLGLNRDDLVRARAAAAQDTSDMLSRIGPGEPYGVLPELVGGRLPYTAVRRALVTQALARAGLLESASPSDLTETVHRLASEPPGIPLAEPANLGRWSSANRAGGVADDGDEPDLPDVAPEPVAEGGAIHLERVEIDHFKAIEHLDLRFREPLPDREPWLLVLGENGVGKSSALKAIALALMDPARRAAAVPDASTAVRIGGRNRRGRIRLTMSDGSTIEVTFQRHDPTFRVTGTAGRFIALGYGPTRMPPPPGAAAETVERIDTDNLFDGRAPLSDVERWLADTGRVPTRQFNLHATDLKSLLPMDEDERILRRGGRLFARSNGVTVPLSELSDGFRSVIALATDMIQHFAVDYQSMQSAEGLVLLDEVEVHLHPRWRMVVIAQLRAMFPRVRFVTTTHDPLCLQQTEPGEVFVMRREPDHAVVAEPLDVPKGLRADQLLTGDWFGLSRTVDADTAAKIQQHNQLLAQRQTAGVRQQRSDLEEELRGRLGHFADSSAERLVQAVTAELTAGQDLGQFTPAQRRSLRDDILAASRRRQARR